MPSKQLPAPVSPGERLGAVDMLRGFALIGILIFNVDHFGLPSSIYLDPSLSGGFEGTNYWVWVFKYTLINQKFFAQFAMLFGAGVVLMWNRFQSREQPMVRWYYRRLVVLLVIGLVHAYLFWDGDILVPYAICGMALYPFRRVRPGRLAALGVVLLLFAQIPMIGAGFMFEYLDKKAQEAQAAIAAGDEIEESERQMVQFWEEIQGEIGIGGALLTKEREIIGHGSWWEIVRFRFPNVIGMHTVMMFLMLFWRICGLMFMGMALMKWDFLTGRRSRLCYGITGLIGYAVGLPLSIYTGTALVEQGFGLISMFSVEASIDAFGSVPLALGHISVVMLLHKAGAFTALRRRLAALGRMALTNYLVHTVIGSVVFFGYGFGLFDQFDRLSLLGIAALIAIIQLVYSPWWLSRYRFGPAEWLWRSLTYGWRQPMRHRQDDPPPMSTAKPVQ